MPLESRSSPRGRKTELAAVGVIGIVAGVILRSLLAPAARTIAVTESAEPRDGAFAPFAELRPEDEALVNALLRGAVPYGEHDVFQYGRQLGYTQSPHPLVGDFDTILRHPRAVAVLERVLRIGSPAARLYALTLLKDLGSERASAWVELMKGDPTPITMGNGCQSYTITVGKAAVDYIYRGKVTFADPESR